MPQIKKNIITGEYISISEARKHRLVTITDGNATCQFCPENKFMTPEETFVSESGRVRIFPNLYPILDQVDELGYGIHEIVVDTKIHTEYFHDFSPEHALETLISIVGRLPALYADKKIRYVQVFKNQGRSAGATVAHSHWQLVGMPFLPSYQEILQKNSERFFIENGCYMCHVLKNGPHIVYENEGAIAFVPEAEKSGYEIDVMPKKHFSGIKDADETQLAYMSDALQKSCKALSQALSADYNICFQNLLFKGCDHLHFYMQVIPRLGRFGGFELSTGSYTHSEYPEKSAEFLKKTIANIYDLR